MNCIICRGPFVDPVTVVHKQEPPDANHAFCKPCLADWLWTCNSLGQDPSCPYCLQPLNSYFLLRHILPICFSKGVLSINNFMKSFFENKKIYGPIFVVLAVVGSKVVGNGDWVCLAGLLGALFGVFVLHTVIAEPHPEAINVIT